MCMVESTAFSARYELPSTHSTPTHLPPSTISLCTVFSVRITPPSDSISFPSACVNAPEPPFGAVQLQRCRPYTSEYASRPVIGSSGGTTVCSAIHNMNARQWSSSKLSRMISHADMAMRRCHTLP